MVIGGTEVACKADESNFVRQGTKRVSRMTRTVGGGAAPATEAEQEAQKEAVVAATREADAADGTVSPVAEEPADGMEDDEGEGIEVNDIEKRNLIGGTPSTPSAASPAPADTSATDAPPPKSNDQFVRANPSGMP